MRKSITIFIAIFVLTIMLLTAPAVYAKISIPEATSDFYVNDFADVFSSSEKSRLMEKAIALSNEHDGIQVVVTTVKSLDGNSVEDYSYEMYNQYGIGKDDMGLLILLATDDRKIRVEIGKSMEAYVNDSKAGRFIDKYAIPSLKEDKFNDGLINLQEALIDEVISCIEKNNEDTTRATRTTNSADKEGSLNIVGISLMVFLIIAVVILIVVLVNKIRTKQKMREEEVANLKAANTQLEVKIANQQQIFNGLEASLNRKIRNLTEENGILETKYQKLKNVHETLEDRYSRAEKLYPNVDSEVTAMIEEEARQRDMVMAEQADSIIAKVIDLTPSKDIVSKLSAAMEHYQFLTAKQKLYVTSDIKKLNTLYDESLRLKKEYERQVEEERNKNNARRAEEEITSIISGISIGRAGHLSRLKKAKSIYDNLDSGARAYFNKSIIDELNRLYKQAKRDKEENERREEEERRRRRTSDNNQNSFSSFGSSTSSFGGSSHFGGFGGHSGGGGASRGF